MGSSWSWSGRKDVHETHAAITLTIPGLNLKQEEPESEVQYDEDDLDEVGEGQLSADEYHGDDNIMYHTDLQDDVNNGNDIKYADIVVNEVRAFIHRRLMEKAVGLVPIQEMLDLRPGPGLQIPIHGYHTKPEGHIQKAIDWHQYSSTFDIDDVLDLGVLSRDYNIHNEDTNMS